ncbi:MAG: hypothetical protein ACTSPV_10865 [Candidatus Hodarchaeales archaeon]
MTQKKINFQVPSSRNTYCELKKLSSGYQISFFKEGRPLKSFKITERDIDREKLRGIAIKAGIDDWYSLSGPYDVADEILRQWHKHFEKKTGLLGRLFGK